VKINFFSELKRRNVIRAAILYVGAVWALAQGISQLGPSVSAPDWATRWFLVAAAIGFPFWIAFAWDGPTLVTTLALIDTWVGEKDLAPQEIAASAQMLVSVSYGELQLSPNWDRLRGDPRFDKIVASLAPH